MSKFEQAVKLLRHKDPAVRRKAITFLAKSGEPDAAKALGWSAKNDPNADLQQLAQKGVAYLRKQQGQSGGNDVTTGGSLLKYGKKATQTTPAVNDIDEMFSLDEDEQETSDYGSEHGYSAYDSYDPTDDEDHDDSAFDFNFEDEDAVEERTGPLDYDARKKVLAAMDLHIEGDDAGAIESLAEAIAIDSRAAADPKALNVASAATGMAGEKAIRMIRSPIDRSRLIDELDGQAGDDFNFGGGKTKRKRAATSNDKSWSAVWADIGVWALVTVAGIIIVGLLTFVRMQPVLREASTNPQVISELAFALETTYEDTEFFLQQAVTDALSGAILVVIVAAVSFVIFDFVRLFLLGYAYHVTANYMLGGGKTMAVTLGAIVNPNTLRYGLHFGALAIAVLILPNTLEPYLTYAAPEGAIDASIIGPLAFYGIVAVIVEIGYLFVILFSIMGALEFGAGRGCLTMIVGGVVYWGISCVFNFGLQILGALFTAGVPPLF